MTRHDALRSLVGVILSALAAVFAMLCAIDAFGWFSLSHLITGAGMNIHSKDASALQIRASADGEDISVSVVEDIVDKDKLAVKSEQTGLYPGTYGSFSFYVHDNSLDVRYPYSFWYRVSVENNQFFNDANYPDGFYPNTEDNRELACQYINSHLMFFTSKDASGVYSGWIRPDAPTECVVDAGPYKVTVYWIWVDNYNRIFDENSGLIKETTRVQIKEYYEQNSEKMFAGGAASTEAYNMADTLIGITIKYICFQLEVTKN